MIQVCDPKGPVYARGPSNSRHGPCSNSNHPSSSLHRLPTPSSLLSGLRKLTRLRLHLHPTQSPGRKKTATDIPLGWGDVRTRTAIVNKATPSVRVTNLIARTIAVGLTFIHVIGDFDAEGPVCIGSPTYNYAEAWICAPAITAGITCRCTCICEMISAGTHVELTVRRLYDVGHASMPHVSGLEELTEYRRTDCHGHCCGDGLCGLSRSALVHGRQCGTGLPYMWL